jgi:hypothetical protein
VRKNKVQGMTERLIYSVLLHGGLKADKIMKFMKTCSHRGCKKTSFSSPKLSNNPCASSLTAQLDIQPVMNLELFLKFPANNNIISRKVERPFTQHQKETDTLGLETVVKLISFSLILLTHNRRRSA